MTKEERLEYFEELAEEYDVPLDVVQMLGDLLGPEEDYDGLVTSVQDAALYDF